MKFIPAIDLKENKCVRLKQGAEKNITIFNDNPLEQAIFFESQGCDRIHIVDGKGHLYETEVSNITSDKCETKIISSKTIKNKVEVHLIICPTKNHKRIEWMLEKIVEIGVDRVSFIISKNTIRNLFKYFL